MIEKIHIPTREEQMDFFAKEEWEKDPEEDLKKSDKNKSKEKAEKKTDEIQAEDSTEKTEEDAKVEGKYKIHLFPYLCVYS